MEKNIQMSYSNTSFVEGKVKGAPYSTTVAMTAS